MILLVGFYVEGIIKVIEFFILWDYIECMFCVFGVDVEVDGMIVSIEGG